MSLELIAIIGIVLIIHGSFSSSFFGPELKGDVGEFMAVGLFIFPITTLITSIPTFIVLGIGYWILDVA